MFGIKRHIVSLGRTANVQHSWVGPLCAFDSAGSCNKNVAGSEFSCEASSCVLEILNADVSVRQEGSLFASFHQDSAHIGFILAQHLHSFNVSPNS